jgi:hypothetical protein
MQRRHGFSWWFSSSAPWTARVEVEDAGAKIRVAMAAKATTSSGFPLTHPTMAVARLFRPPDDASTQFEQKKLQVFVEKHYTKKCD